MKKPSSVLQYNDSYLALAGANIFGALPFVVEIRCLLDFTFSKTSLDIFQFWQLWQYHCEMYCARNGNFSYTTRVLGTPTERLDKCIFGVCISVIILFLLVGPLVFFSDVGGFVRPNPVRSADIEVALVITKTLNSSVALSPLALMSAVPSV
jgi:piezo-type mechanosensitive ion channel component 1/2